MNIRRNRNEWAKIINEYKNSGQTLANWVIHGSEDWLSIIYDRMHEYLLKQDILHADETPLQVLHDYRTTRTSKHPQNFLAGFNGYIHTDGYTGYNSIPNVTIVGCWAHARRGFTDALKALPDTNSSSGLASKEGLDYCNKLFGIEQSLASLKSEERYNKRLEQSKPVLEAFLSWLQTKSKQTLPKSTLGKAIAYCLNQWEKLEAFLLDGRLEISNNRAEREIKPFVLGRKNWLFSNTAKGATASAIAYSIIETAKANSLNPFYYLTFLFERLIPIILNNLMLCLLGQQVYEMNANVPKSNGTIASTYI